MRARCLLVLFLLLSHPTNAAELKIATWNLNWLTSRAGGLPGDVKLRAPEDFDRLRAYAMELDAGLIAIQEVDNAETAYRVFPHELYAVHMTRDRVRQRVGFAVRRDLAYDVNPDLTSLASDPIVHLRSGADITLRPPGGPLRVLALHLKQGCQYRSLSGELRGSCLTLMEQRDALLVWIAARRDEGVPFLVLGDFNRGMDKRDPFIREIHATAPIARATEGLSSPCWGHEAFIDHILAGGPARLWLRPGSLRVMTYRETGDEWKERLSDHCPVSARIALPD